MAKDKKEKKQKGDKAPASKQLKKAKAQWEELEREIDKEFVLLQKQGYPKDELETLRWDYRYTKLPDFKITQEQMEYFVAAPEAIAAGVEPPPPPGESETKAEAGGAAAAAPVDEEYKRKSKVDMDLVEKYLEHRVGRETRTEMSSLYKEAFGEDLHVPDKLDLTDISYAQDMTAAVKPGRLSKSEILGVPDDAKPVTDVKRVEAPAVAPAPVGPKVKRPSQLLGLLLAFKRGVPEYPTYDEKWWVGHPFRFWVIPKRLAGKSVPKYYGIFAANLAILIVQFFPLLGLPILLRLILWAIRYVWLKFIKNRLTPAMASLKEKAAIQPAGAAAPAAAAAAPAPAPAPEPKKEPAPANTG
jgi:hypothetical protein